MSDFFKKNIFTRYNCSSGLVFFLFFVYCVEVSAQNGYEIGKIKFNGNKSFSKSELLKQTTLHETKWLDKVLSKKKPVIYNENFIQSDIDRLVRFYQCEGFLNASVELDSVAQNDKKEKVDLYFKIVENKPVLVGEVKIKIEDSLKVKKDSFFLPFRKRMLTVSGKRFSDQKIYNDINLIKDFFQNKGFAYAECDQQIHLQPDLSKADVIFSVKLNEKCFFGNTTIEGNKYVKDQLIYRQCTFDSGQVFNKKKIDKTRKHLFDLQLFRIISLQPLLDNTTKRNPIPVKINVEETSRLSTEFGIGYGTEDEFRAFVDVSYRSLFGDASRLHLYLKHSSLEPYHASLSWIQPQFFSKNFSFSVYPFLLRQKEPGYNIQSYGVNLPLTYSISEKMNTSFGYYMENVKQYEGTTNGDYINPESKDYLYDKSGLMFSYNFNNSYPLTSPVRGNVFNASVKMNGYIFHSDFNYVRCSFDARRYDQIANFSLAGRILIGGIFSSDSSKFVPVEDRFYSGGSNSIRGWGRSRLGPLRDDGSPMGGKSVLEMSVEVRHRLFWLLEGAMFLDMGNVWNSSFHYPFNQLAYTAGCGLRINSPIGVVRLDVGFPLWNAKKSPQVFLNIGQAF